MAAWVLVIAMTYVGPGIAVTTVPMANHDACMAAARTIRDQFKDNNITPVLSCVKTGA